MPVEITPESQVQQKTPMSDRLKLQVEPQPVGRRESTTAGTECSADNQLRDLNTTVKS